MVIDFGFVRSRIDCSRWSCLADGKKVLWGCSGVKPGASSAVGWNSMRRVGLDGWHVPKTWGDFRTSSLVHEIFEQAYSRSIRRLNVLFTSSRQASHFRTVRHVRKILNGPMYVLFTSSSRATAAISVQFHAITKMIPAIAMAFGTLIFSRRNTVIFDFLIG